MSKRKKSFTLYTAPNAENRDSRNLSLSTFRPNSRYSVNRAASGTRQPPMPSPILSSSSLFLRFAHPVRNHKNTNQLLYSNSPALRQLFQFQEYSPIKNLHEFYRFFTVAHLRSTTLNHADTLWLYMAHLLFLENNVESIRQSIKS